MSWLSQWTKSDSGETASPHERAGMFRGPPLPLCMESSSDEGTLDRSVVATSVISARQLANASREKR
jgi:hypothetical protein